MIYPLTWLEGEFKGSSSRDQWQYGSNMNDNDKKSRVSVITLPSALALCNLMT